MRSGDVYSGVPAFHLLVQAFNSDGVGVGVVIRSVELTLLCLI